MKGRLLGSESHNILETNSEIDNAIAQSRSTPSILPSLPIAHDHSMSEDKSEFQAKKETTSHFVERIRANSTSSTQGGSEAPTPLDGSPMKMEFRKSRSLVKKIQERTANKEAALKLDPPKEMETSVPPVEKTPSSSSRHPSTKADAAQTTTPRGIIMADPLPISSPVVATAPKSISKLHASPHSKPMRQRQIPGLSLERVQSSPSPQMPLNGLHGDASMGMGGDSPAIFQHFSFPKSLAASSTPQSQSVPPVGSSTTTTSSSSSVASSSVAPMTTSATNHHTTTLGTAASPMLNAHHKSTLISPMPTEYRSRTKIAETLTEFVVVENTQAAPKSDTRAVENDRILQQRLQQAKALERKNETNGAVMFKFALWGKPKDTATAHDNDDAATIQDTTAQPKSGSKLRGPKIARENQLGGETAATTSATLDEEATAISLFPPSMIPVQPAVPRTPQRVLRSQSVPTTPATVTLLQAKTPMAPPNTVAPVKPSTATGASTTTTTTHNIHHDDDYDESYSDDDFERTGDEDSRSHHSAITANAAVTATVTASAGNNEASAANDEPVRSHSNEQSLGTASGNNQPAVRNLAMALRTLVVEAKSMGSEYSSPAQSGSDPHRDPHQHLSPQPSQNTILHGTAAVEDDVDVENSYSSFVLLSQQQKQLSALSQSVGEDIPPVEDEDSSDDWNDSPEDEGRRGGGGGGGGGVRRSFSAEHLDGCDTPQSIQTVMSKSGPAAFLSSMSSISSSVADASKAPAAQAAQGPSVSGNTEPVTIGGGATSSFNRNRRANSCGVSEMRTTMQGIAYNKESGGGDGAAAMATATTAAADGGGGGDLPGSLTSLTSRDERKPTGKLTPTTVPQSQTPESYRYSSRPEASTHSRYQAMRQTREAMKRSSATSLAKEPAESSSAAMTTSSSPAPASTTTSPEQAGGGAGGTHERDEVPSWSSADGNSSGLPSYGDRGYYSSPDNHSLSVGGDVEGIPPSRSTAANGQSLPSASQGDCSTDADFCTPRLTEMSDSEDEILGIRKSAAAAGGGHVPAVEPGVVAGRVAVTPLNPTGNPFHRFAEPVRGSGGGNAATTAIVSAVNGNGLAAMPPLASQPQPVVPIAEFLATISSRTNAAAATAAATTTATAAATAATATAITATTAAAVTATASTLSVDTAAPKTPATAASSGAPTAAATTTTAAAASSLDEKPSSPLKWIKGDVIGEGTFGKVYKGLNQSTGELLAIKQFYLADGSEEEVDDLQKEIAVMWELDHEHIVRYLGTSKTDRFLYIVLEYVTGGSIASMLAQYGPFTESLIRRFSLHILSGMQYLHSQGIIHRDIKGANILVTDAGIAKLADFGCSKRLAGLCTTSLEESMHIMRGSVPWMAPEVIKQAGYGRSSDMWSFGATLIEMATGKPPWSEYTNNLATLFHVATSNQPPPTPSHLSGQCRVFLESCVRIDPDQRATAASLLQESPFMQEEIERAAEQTRRRVQQQATQQQQTVVVPAKALYSTPARRDRVQRPGSAANAALAATATAAAAAAPAEMTATVPIGQGVDPAAVGVVNAILTPRKALTTSFDAAADVHQST